MGCDGRCGVRRALLAGRVRLQRTAKSCGPNHCAGKAGMSRLYLSNPCAFVRYFSHTVLRAQSAPGFSLRPLQEGANEIAEPGRKRAAGMRTLAPLSSTAKGPRERASDDRLRRATRYSRKVSDETDRPRRTGYPACAGYDGCAQVAPRRNDGVTHIPIRPARLDLGPTLPLLDPTKQQRGEIPPPGRRRAPWDR
jgi:hypothetical protein